MRYGLIDYSLVTPYETVAFDPTGNLFIEECEFSAAVAAERTKRPQSHGALQYPGTKDGGIWNAQARLLGAGGTIETQRSTLVAALNDLVDEEGTLGWTNPGASNDPAVIYAAALATWQSRWTTLVEPLAPAAWLRLDDLANPPVSNGYDAAVAALGPVAQWTVNETSGGPGATFADASGNGNTLTVSGGTITTGQASPLIGSSGTSVLTQAAGGKVGTGTTAPFKTSAFSYSLWVKPTNLNGVAYRGLAGAVGATYGWGLYFNPGGTLAFYTKNAGVQTYGPASAAMVNDTWYHVVITYENGLKRIFVDGVLANETAITYDNTSNDATSFEAFGSISVAGSPGANGVESPSWFDRALTPAEIGDLFVLGRPAIDAGTSVNAAGNTYDATVLADADLVAYWPLDETSGTTADNAEGTAAYDLTIIGSPTLASGGPLIGETNGGNAITLNGSSQRFSGSAYAAALNPAQFTIEALIYRNALGAMFLVSETGSGLGLYLSTTAADKLQLSLGDGAFSTAATGATTLSTGRWIHVAATYDGTTAKLYVDGRLDGSGTDAYTPNATGPLFVGHQGGSGHFNGIISRLSICDAAKSEAVIYDRFQRGRSRANHQAGMIGLPTAAAGLIGGDTNGAFEFDGSTQALVSPYSAQLNPKTFTIHGIIKRSTDTGAAETLVYSLGSNTGYVLRIDSSDKLNILLANGATIAHNHSGATSIPVDEAVHVAVTYDGTNTRLYIDGQLDGTSGAFTTFVPNTTGPTAIARDLASGLYFPGAVDELFVIPDVVLTQEQLASLYATTSEAAPTQAAHALRLTGLQLLEDVAFAKDGGTLVAQFQLGSEKPFAEDYLPTIVDSDPLATGGGGFSVPLTIPMTLTASSGGDLVVTHEGDFKYAYPVLRAYGPAINPVLINHTVGERLVFEGSIAAGDYWEIDLFDKSVKLNGVSPIRALTAAESTWWKCVRGDNDLQFSCSGYTSTTFLRAFMRSTWG